MAVAVMSEPGHPSGPCHADCEQHRACRASRAMAAEPCAGCGQPIGYETPFTVLPGGWLAHDVCMALEVAA